MVNGMRTGDLQWRARTGMGAVGIALAFLAAPAAAADPVDSGEPAPQAVADVTPVPAAVPPAPAAVPGSAAPTDGVAHLPSPDNLPPGTTQAAPEGPNTSYLRYLWQAVRTPGVTMSDALLLIAQRPLDSQSPPNSATTVPPVPVVTPTESTVVAIETP